MPDATPPTDVAAILAELDRRLQDREAELAAVGAVAPVSSPSPRPAPARSEPEAGSRAEPEAPAAATGPDPAEAVVGAIRAAVDQDVEVGARADDALVRRVDRGAPTGPAPRPPAAPPPR